MSETFYYCRGGVDCLVLFAEELRSLRVTPCAPPKPLRPTCPKLKCVAAAPSPFFTTTTE